MEALEAWALSGAMALTGRPDGPPMVAPGDAALQVAQSLDRIGFCIPGLLGERSAYTGFKRNGVWSCGGAMRILPTKDGHVALSLPRESDWALVPALVESNGGEPWESALEWAARTTTDAAEARIHLLGLAGGAVPTSQVIDRPGIVTQTLGARRATDQVLIVNLGSLWAGPLCANLLGLRGAQIVKVESTKRPDGARRGSPAFFNMLHKGHRQLQLNFATDVPVLRQLIAEADLVIEASRPRALRNLGLIAEDVVASGTSWLSITARGRSSNTVGFGDDVSAAAGMVVRHDGDLLPVGDALADPMAGVAAAEAAIDVLASSEARLIDVSMIHVVAESVGPVPAHEVTFAGGAWHVESESGRFRVSNPAVRP